MFFQFSAGNAGRAIQQGGGSAGENQAAAVLPAARAKVDDMVGGEDKVLMVLDGKDGMSLRGQCAQGRYQDAHVRQVQAGGGLVQYIENIPGAGLGQLGRQFYPLRFAARKRGAGLAQL